MKLASCLQENIKTPGSLAKACTLVRTELDPQNLALSNAGLAVCLSFNLVENCSVNSNNKERERREEEEVHRIKFGPSFAEAYKKAFVRSS